MLWVWCSAVHVAKSSEHVLQLKRPHSKPNPADLVSSMLNRTMAKKWLKEKLKSKNKYEDGVWEVMPAHNANGKHYYVSRTSAARQHLINYCLRYRTS